MFTKKPISDLLSMLENLFILLLLNKVFLYKVYVRRAHNIHQNIFI